MGLIYAHAAVTIAAAAGEDPSYGIPGVQSSSEDRRRLRAQPIVSVCGRPFAAANLDSSVLIAQSAWRSRGWTYQEELLSTRLLAFTDSQVSFQCKVSHHHESVDFPLDTTHDIDNGRADVALLSRVFPKQTAMENRAMMYERISAYSRRTLTHDQDALDAFRGILQRFSTMDRPVRHFYGLLIPTESWLEMDEMGILYGLTWRLSGFTLDFTQENRLRRRRMFPSWSWVDWALDPVHRPRSIRHSLHSNYDSDRADFDLRETQYKTYASVRVRFGDDDTMPWSTWAANRPGEVHESNSRRQREPQAPALVLKGIMMHIRIGRGCDTKAMWPWHNRDDSAKHLAWLLLDNALKIILSLGMPHKQEGTRFTIMPVLGTADSELVLVVAVQRSGRDADETFERIDAVSISPQTPDATTNVNKAPLHPYMQRVVDHLWKGRGRELLGDRMSDLPRKDLVDDELQFEGWEEGEMIIS